MDLVTPSTANVFVRKALVVKIVPILCVIQVVFTAYASMECANARLDFLVKTASMQSAPVVAVAMVTVMDPFATASQDSLGLHVTSSIVRSYLVRPCAHHCQP